MPSRGVRGATTVNENTPEAIQGATSTLLAHIVQANNILSKDITSVIFTATEDLDAAYPAPAAREMGWTHVPLLCMQEMAVPNSLKMCVRVLIHWNTTKNQTEIHHIYLGQARTLRPDLNKEGI